LNYGGLPFAGITGAPLCLKTEDGAQGMEKKNTFQICDLQVAIHILQLATIILWMSMIIFPVGTAVSKLEH